MSKTCETCGYWGYWVEGKDTGQFRLCICPKIRKEITIPVREINQFSPDEAIVEFDEEWGLLTGPKFGCIHHKPKDGKQMKITSEGLIEVALASGIYQIKISQNWKEHEGKRPYKYARARPDGTIHPVRYAGLKGVIGEIQTRGNHCATIRIQYMETNL